jgi:isopenicillin N synthase-like dioxygenase
MSAALDAMQISSGALPIIDVSGLAAPDYAARLAVAEALRAACTDKGFLYITHHGIPQALIDAAVTETKAFFAQPMEVKLQTDKAHSICNRGYETLRAQTLEAGAPPDLKESFYIGEDLPLDDPRVLAGSFNQGPNQWPAALPGFRPAMQAYFDALIALGERIMRGLALSLDLPEDHFAGFCDQPMGTLRLLHYPPQPANAAPGEKGAGAHTDFGGLTFLLQHEIGGLQVWDAAEAAWIHAPPIPGTYVVNLGDMIARWTNDRYRSTLHRVVNASGQERYSLPFFYSGNPDHRVECLPTCRTPGQPPLYSPTTVQEHLREMYRKTYA